jgi:zinc transport system ATP-binding protein
MNLTSARRVLHAAGVSFGYGPDPVLDDVGLELRPGEFVALVGPNGSGKSTLLRVLLGLLTPWTGTVELFGARPAALRDRWRLGYVSQRARIEPSVPVTVEEAVATGRLARQDHALDSVALAELRKAPLASLSGGQQQRVLIAKALASEPELLILDEPVAGVDAAAQRQFRDSLVHLVAEHGAAVLLVSHELGAVADDLDRVVVLKRRVVFDGPPGELAATGVSLGIHADDLPLWLEELK